MIAFRSLQLGLAVLLALAALPNAPARAAGGSVPRPLPSHFVFGLANGPQAFDWLVETKVPVEMRYQYLSAGVNTGKGWATWGENGSFVTDYVRDSRRLGLISVFTYYMLLQSRPALGDGEAEKLYSNLNNVATMRAYYEDFKLLMRRAGAAGGPVIVHVEPDLFGYLQKEYAGGGRGSTGQIRAAVSSTGLTELQGLPNTAEGFGRALLRLRNRYGQGVLLGIHASHWATGDDVGSARERGMEARSIGRRTARFLRGFGEGWNLVFVDPSDRDSAWKDAQYGRDAHWWDLTDHSYPNFERYRQWIDGVSSELALRVVVWQVPVGNTFFRSMNNTPGHYQDNRAQYFLEDRQHIARWAQAGVVAMLFGAGAGGTTDYTDARKNGITNPPPINGNNRVAQYADDDGGYLRTAITRYYRVGPVPVPR